MELFMTFCCDCKNMIRLHLSPPVCGKTRISYVWQIGFAECNTVNFDGKCQMFEVLPAPVKKTWWKRLFA